MSCPQTRASPDDCIACGSGHHHTCSNGCGRRYPQDRQAGQHASLLKPLAKGKLTIELVETAMNDITSTDQMLLLNLLGGRLPLGYRMIGESPDVAKQNVIARLDRVLRRIRRVGDMIEEVLTTGDE